MNYCVLGRLSFLLLISRHYYHVKQYTAIILIILSSLLTCDSPPVVVICVAEPLELRGLRESGPSVNDELTQTISAYR